MSKKTIFIVDPANAGWIIEKLMQDIKHELINRGFDVEIGSPDQYSGQEVIFNSRYLDLYTNKIARINSIFVTHVDDILKEYEVRNFPFVVNNVVCMSPSEANDIRAILNRSDIDVVGINLPARNIDVKPFKFCIFSACYSDGRKNENWIIDYFKERDEIVKSSFIFRFMGDGWSHFSKYMERIDLNYEVCRYSLNLKNEYQYYKNNLQDIDYMLYLGFDGGAMSVYDSVNANVPFIFPYNSYHLNLDSNSQLFKDKNDFFLILDKLHDMRMERLEALNSRSIMSYVDKLIFSWGFTNENFSRSNDFNENLHYKHELNRVNYKNISFKRFISFTLRCFQRLKNR
jgi:hypothetical protein